MKTRDERETWAEDHGYVHGRCRIHGPFWADCGFHCPACTDENPACENGQEQDNSEAEEENNDAE